MTDRYVADGTECSAYNCAIFAERVVDGSAYCESHARQIEDQIAKVDP